MTDDTSKAGKHDRIRINVNQVHERRYWCKALGATAAYLREVVKEVGPMVPDVKRRMIERIDEAT